jgi:hypothetical protein
MIKLNHPSVRAKMHAHDFADALTDRRRVEKFYRRSQHAQQGRVVERFGSVEEAVKRKAGARNGEQHARSGQRG